MTQEQVTKPEDGAWPTIFNRYLNSLDDWQTAESPRKTTRRYHGQEIQVWSGRVHVEDIDGWVENVRIRHFLNQWRKRVGDPNRRPTTDEIYDFMIQADDEMTKSSQKPFHLKRMAENIASNGMQEPVFLHLNDKGEGTLWDGNRRRYGTHHIMVTPEFLAFRENAQWVPAYVHEPTGNPVLDKDIKHKVLTELNFKEKDHIPWPAFVKAEEIYNEYQERVSSDPHSPALSKKTKEFLAVEFGLSGWRQADRWIKMYDLADAFKDHMIDVDEIDETDIDLFSQKNFEYFDELSKPGVWGAVQNDLDARQEVFDWFWKGKFKSWTDVRMVPKILADPEARNLANSDDAENGIKRAIQAVIANDPAHSKDKTSANERIKHFADWLDSFRREDYLKLEADALERLTKIAQDTANILTGLQKL